MPKQVSEKVKTLLKTVVQNCEVEDRAVRERQIRTWRRLKLLWEGFSRVYYSEIAHDWRIWDEQQDTNVDQSYYDKPVNVFRAYLESIIAALSITVPQVKCYPDDADNTLDRATAKAGDKISQITYRHNDVPLLWLHSLFIYCTEGLVGCYTYTKESEEFGTYEEKQTEDSEETHQYTTCSVCGFQINDTILGQNQQQQPTDPQSQQQNGVQTPQVPQQQQQQQSAMPMTDSELIDQEMSEFNPGPDDAELHALLAEGKDICPACMQMMDPEVSQETFIVTRIVGKTTQPKSRVCMESYGGLNFKVPNYARKQKDCPYLIFSEEIHYAMAMEEFEHLRGNDELRNKMDSGNNPGAYELYDQWGRLSPQYQGEYPINVVTRKKAWLRPAAFNIVKADEDYKELKKLFPDGVKVTYVNDVFAEAENENVDDHWTLTYNPMADYLHHDPLGMLITSMQEITNDLVSLVLQTIEHGVSMTFADPKVLDFKAFESTEITPGGVFPAQPRTGKTLQDGFYELRTSTLSGEIINFFNQVQSTTQLVSGALPSLFGGQIEGSETASQYSMSRAQAQQRLQNVWKMFSLWWKQIFGKVIPMQMKEIKDDERDVQKDKNGNFINVFIRKAELEGKIGKIELEASENLPLTWAQQKDVWMNLLQSQNPEIMKLIAAPENIAILRDAIGLTDVYAPGEDDKDKQYDEIQQLLDSEPLVGPDGMEQPSVDIDPDYDNHAIEFELVREWAIGEAGRETKITNPNGYRNVLLHGKLHLQAMQPPPMAPMQGHVIPPKPKLFQPVPPQPANDGMAPPSKPDANLATPIQGEQDVQTVQ